MDKKKTDKSDEFSKKRIALSILFVVGFWTVVALMFVGFHYLYNFIASCCG